VDKLQAMMVFTTVVDRGGFTAAGSKLEMSPSGVTKTIAALEADLGVQLLNRTTRRTALTEYGRQFYDHCTEILSAIGNAESSIRDRNNAPTGRVQIIMPYSFGRVTFAPELPRFARLYPGIELDVFFGDEPTDIIKEGFDLAVLVRDLTDSRLIRRVLHQGPQVTVASPEFVKDHGAPEHPRELADYDCIIGNFGDEWAYQENGGETMTVRVRSRVRLHSGDAVLEAAVAGLGYAQSTWWLFRKELQSGKLVTVLDRYAKPGMPVSVLYPAKQYLPRKVSSVISFLDEITKPTRV
jgi:DNA-binding transcriptional LysR family regulator